MSAILFGSPCRRINDPVAFTCAVLALAQQRSGDRVVDTFSLDRVVPFVRSDAEALPPSFFRAVQRFRDHQLRMEPA
jgi:hypothetical protein